LNVGDGADKWKGRCRPRISSFVPFLPSIEANFLQVKELGVTKEVAEETLRSEKDITKALIKLTAPGRR
jgi:hypothetical protein